MAALLKHKLELGDGDPRPLLRFFLPHSNIAYISRQYHGVCMYCVFTFNYMLAY